MIILSRSRAGSVSFIIFLIFIIMCVCFKAAVGKQNNNKDSEGDSNKGDSGDDDDRGSNKGDSGDADDRGSNKGDSGDDDDRGSNKGDSGDADDRGSNKGGSGDDDDRGSNKSGSGEGNKSNNKGGSGDDDDRGSNKSGSGEEENKSNNKGGSGDDDDRGSNKSGSGEGNKSNNKGGSGDDDDRGSNKSGSGEGNKSNNKGGSGDDDDRGSNKSGSGEGNKSNNKGGSGDDDDRGSNKSGSGEEENKSNNKGGSGDDDNKSSNKDDSSRESSGINSDNAVCPDGLHVKDGRTCYYYHSSPLAWEAAETACRKQQGMLAIFENFNKARTVLGGVQSLLTGDSTTMLWVGISRSSDGAYSWTNGGDISGAWTGKITIDIAGQGRGCVAVDMTDVDSVLDIALSLKDCSTTELSYLCMVDTAKAVWTAWSTWAECSATCGTGRRKRQRVCLETDSGVEGPTCHGDDAEEEDCSLSACPVQDYNWETWGEWSTCNATCGGGRRSRSRRCLDSVSGSQDQSQCTGNGEQTESCNTHACANYNWETWGEWSTCNATCGGGQRSRSRRCVDGVSGSQDQSQCTGNGEQTESCNTHICANYDWETWGDWSVCSATCGGGQRSRSRRCVDSVSGSQDQSQCTGNGEQIESCNTHTCAIYNWETWGDWSVCNATCGSGQRSRSRRCVDSVSGSQDQSQCTGNGEQTESCNTHTCANYDWETWGEWSACNATCGGGQRSRSRRCVDSVSGSQDQSQCTGNGEQTESCNTHTCANYDWEMWGEWSVCNATCGGGQRSRSRRCVDSVNGSQDQSQCTGNGEQTESCNTHACANYDWETWGEWSACNATCSGGQRSRSRRCVDSVSGSQDQSQCTGNGEQTESCNTHTCANYDWETWGEWSACSAPCGGSQRSRSRRCVDSVSGSQDQSQCTGNGEQTESCNTHTCANYDWETWGEWSACNATCGGGQRSRSRLCVDSVSGSQDQSQCTGNGEQTESCNTHACATFDWETWVPWSACSASCEGGRRSRSRRCMDSVSGNEAAGGPAKCPGEQNTEEEEECNMHKCPEPEWEDWAQWSVCSKTCGKGFRTRLRVCTVAGVASNKCSGRDADSKSCFTVCKVRGMSKVEMVRQIASQLDVEKAAKLEKWAETTEHMQENIFVAKNLKNYTMAGHVIVTHDVASLIVCVLKCMSTEGCKSFNFQFQAKDSQLGKHACELNSVSRDDAVGDVRRRDGYTLYDFKTFVPFIDD